MSQIVQKLYSFETKNFYYLAVTDDGQLNQQNNETYDLQSTNSKIFMTVKLLSII